MASLLGNRCRGYTIHGDSNEGSRIYKIAWYSHRSRTQLSADANMAMNGRCLLSQAFINITNLFGQMYRCCCHDRASRWDLVDGVGCNPDAAPTITHTFVHYLGNIITVHLYRQHGAITSICCNPKHAWNHCSRPDLSKDRSAPMEAPMLVSGTFSAIKSANGQSIKCGTRKHAYKVRNRHYTNHYPRLLRCHEAIY